MWVLNIDELPNIKLFRCGKTVAKWLEKEKFIYPLATDKNGKYCFVDNDLLKETLETKPFYIFDIF